MSRRMVGATMLAMALLAGCADEGDSEPRDERENADQASVEHGGAEHDEGAAPDADEGEIAESQHALTAPSFALISQHSGKAMTAGSLSVGTQVSQQGLLGTKGGPAQRWVSVNQSITLESQPNLCLQAASGSSGAKLTMQTCNGGPLQGWRLELKLQNGVKLARWKNLPSGLYLDTDGATRDGSAMVVRPFSGGVTQLFSRLF